MPQTYVKIIIGEREVKLEIPSYIYTGHDLLLPIEFISEELGFKISSIQNSLDKQNKKLFLSGYGKGVIVELGKDLAYVNGKPILMDSPAQLNEDKIYVSIKFLLDALDIDFDYSSEASYLYFFLENKLNRTTQSEDLD